MGTFLYVLIAFAWIISSILIGRYIIGSLLGKPISYKLGLKAILVSYMIGILMLFAVISNL